VLAASLKDRTAGDWQAAHCAMEQRSPSKRKLGRERRCGDETIQAPESGDTFCELLNAHKGTRRIELEQFRHFSCIAFRVSSPDLNQPDKNPSKSLADRISPKLYSEASKAVNVDFAWAPWFAFANDILISRCGNVFGQMTAKTSGLMPGRTNVSKCKDEGYEVKAK